MRVVLQRYTTYLQLNITLNDILYYDAGVVFAYLSVNRF